MVAVSDLMVQDPQRQGRVDEDEQAKKLRLKFRGVRSQGADALVRFRHRQASPSTSAISMQMQMQMHKTTDQVRRCAEVMMVKRHGSCRQLLQALLTQRCHSSLGHIKPRVEQRLYI